MLGAFASFRARIEIESASWLGLWLIQRLGEYRGWVTLLLLICLMRLVNLSLTPFKLRLLDLNHWRSRGLKPSSLRTEQVDFELRTIPSFSSLFISRWSFPRFVDFYSEKVLLFTVSILTERTAYNLTSTPEAQMHISTRDPTKLTKGTVLYLRSPALYPRSAGCLFCHWLIRKHTTLK